MNTKVMLALFTFFMDMLVSPLLLITFSFNGNFVLHFSIFYPDVPFSLTTFVVLLCVFRLKTLESSHRLIKISFIFSLVGIIILPL